MTEVTVVVRILEIIGVFVTGLPRAGTGCLLISVLQAETFALIRGEKTQRSAQFQVLVGISDTPLEAQTELGTYIAVHFLAGVVVTVGTVCLLQFGAQILARCLLCFIAACLIGCFCCIVRSLCCSTLKISCRIINRVLVCAQSLLLAVAFVPCLTDIGTRDTACYRRQINREISALVALLPVNTDRHIRVGRSQPFGDNVVVTGHVVTTQSVLALETSQYGQIPVLLELPTELGCQLDIIARLLECILLLVNPGHSEIRIKVGLPCDSVLVVQQVQFGINDTVHVVLTTGSPVYQTRCGGIQTYGSVKLPCLLGVLQFLEVRTRFGGGFCISGYGCFIYILCRKCKRCKQAQRQRNKFTLHIQNNKIVCLYLTFSLDGYVIRPIRAQNY